MGKRAGTNAPHHHATVDGRRAWSSFGHTLGAVLATRLEQIATLGAGFESRKSATSVKPQVNGSTLVAVSQKGCSKRDQLLQACCRFCSKRDDTIWGVTSLARTVLIGVKAFKLKRKEVRPWTTGGLSSSTCDGAKPRCGRPRTSTGGDCVRWRTESWPICPARRSARTTPIWRHGTRFRRMSQGATSTRFSRESHGTFR